MIIMRRVDPFHVIILIPVTRLMHYKRKSDEVPLYMSLNISDIFRALMLLKEHGAPKKACCVKKSCDTIA